MLGTIELEKLPVRCIVGILPRERVEEQTIHISVRMTLDFAAAASSEDVEDTVDYAALAVQLKRSVVHGKFRLIETMAEHLAQEILEQQPLVQEVAVVIHKPAAVPEAQDTRVSVVRHR